MDARQVTIGGQTRTIEKFSARKVAVALKVIEHLAKAYEDVQDDMADFRKEYGEKRPIRMTRDQVGMHAAELQAAIGQAETDTEMEPLVRARAVRALRETAESYQRLLDGPLADKDSVERPGAPSSEEVFLHVVSRGFDEAESEIVQLLGLALMGNHEVGQARRQGNIEEVMQTSGDEAMDMGDIDEVLTAAHAAAEMLLGDLAERKKLVGKIGALFLPEATEEAAQTATEAPSTLTTSNPPGSIDSPMPTDGTPTTPSTESPTASASGS